MKSFQVIFCLSAILLVASLVSSAPSDVEKTAAVEPQPTGDLEGANTFFWPWWPWFGGGFYGGIGYGGGYGGGFGPWY